MRSGGRWVLCKKYLLKGEITWKEYPLGEGAHIVGRSDSKRSPHGKDPLACNLWLRTRGFSGYSLNSGPLIDNRADLLFRLVGVVVRAGFDPATFRFSGGRSSN